MLIRLHGVIFAALAACSTRTVSERERALERIPATAQLVFAADGATLSTPPFKRVLESLTSHVPPTLTCVVEAAFASDTVAIAVQLDAGTTIIVESKKRIEGCPVLSKLSERVWVATIGSGAPAESRARSILASSTWDRARPYLQREPVALAGELPQMRLVAVAQPEPLDAWLAIDATDPAAVEAAIQAMLDRWRVPPTIELSAKLKMSRAGTQVSVQTDALTVDDLVTIIRDTVEVAEAPPPPPSISSAFLCPANPGYGIVSCHDGTHYKVSSVETIMKTLATLDATPVIAAGDVIGIELVAEPPLPFVRGDIILGVDSHRIADRANLAMLAPSLAGSAAVAVRRGGIDAVLSLSE